MKNSQIQEKSIKMSKGLGDSIEKVAKTVGVKLFVEKLAKITGIDDCGCKKRKDALNKIFSYKLEKRI